MDFPPPEPNDFNLEEIKMESFLGKVFPRKRGSQAFLRWLFTAGVLLLAGTLSAQVDPGPRGGPPGAGGPVPTLNFNETTFWFNALFQFQTVFSVSGTIAGEPGLGLGPGFNGNGCALCHAEPAVGGSSPGFNSPVNPVPNPQIALATLDGATNVVPPFIFPKGPVREARFIMNTAGGLDGGVHNLYSIQGRFDAPGCGLPQENFPPQLANNNVVFRIPTPTFGLGFVENTPDSNLQANLAANAAAKAALGIAGRFNTSGNDGTITRFGWKAQNKSLLIFSGEASNVEQGIANDVFSNERNAILGCVFNVTPEDTTHLIIPPGPGAGDFASQISSLQVNFAAFMRLNAVPVPVPFTPSAANGQALFGTSAAPGIGCVLCHSDTLKTAASPFTGMSFVKYQPFSDFALHHMGSTLADGVSQGDAGPDEFRTAPLWGVGQRLFFLHDGRTTNLLTAIKMHSSPAANCINTTATQNFTVNGVAHAPSTIVNFCGSEANAVINNFFALAPGQQQDILNFLRSL
jgi:CxxC motif-containing protein (DUF1111 family)